MFFRHFIVQGLQRPDKEEQIAISVLTFLYFTSKKQQVGSSYGDSAIDGIMSILRLRRPQDSVIIQYCPVKAPKRPLILFSHSSQME